MNHAGGGGYGSGPAKPTNKIADEASEVESIPKETVSYAQPWVNSMDDASVKHYLHRETRRVNELHRALDIAEDFLRVLEKVAEERGLDIFD